MYVSNRCGRNVSDICMYFLKTLKLLQLPKKPEWHQHQPRRLHFKYSSVLHTVFGITHSSIQIHFRPHYYYQSLVYLRHKWRQMQHQACKEEEASCTSFSTLLLCLLLKAGFSMFRHHDHNMIENSTFLFLCVILDQL